jgi:Ras family protein
MNPTDQWLSGSSGKSSLVIQFIENHFVENYYPTIESSASKSIKYNGVDYDCEIIDTAGQVCSHFIHNAHPLMHISQDEFSIFHSKHAIGIHGYILVYSTTSRNSFNMVQPLYDRIIDFRGTADIPCVIVGAKIDLDR